MTLNGIGLIEMSSGNFAAAEQAHKRALAIREGHGDAQSETAESLANLAAVYLTQNRYADAAPLFTRAMAIWEKTLDPNHPNIALCLDGIGTAYVGEGQYAQAEPLLRRALAIREKVYGPQHPAVAEVIESLALLYRRQGEYALAAPLYERMVAIEEAVQKPDSPASRSSTARPATPTAPPSSRRRLLQYARLPTEARVGVIRLSRLHRYR
jgi:tetratricopeptide (TPR) repeat protein